MSNNGKNKLLDEKGGPMPTPTSLTQATGAAIDYQKAFVERVFIKKDGPTEPDGNSTGGELLHGFLSDVYRLGLKDEKIKETIEFLCRKWSVFYT